MHKFGSKYPLQTECEQKLTNSRDQGAAHTKIVKMENVVQWQTFVKAPEEIRENEVSVERRSNYAK